MESFSSALLAQKLMTLHFFHLIMKVTLLEERVPTEICDRWCD